jgi:hypothetical protein
MTMLRLRAAFQPPCAARRNPQPFRHLPASAAAILLALLPAGRAQLHATTLARMDVRELARQSAYIARARCMNTASQSAAGQVWTLSTFVVTEAWKGNPPSPFTVRLPGGQAAGLRVTVEGAPRFAAGEDVVLFLTPDSSRGMSIISWAQGTFRVRRNPRTGDAVVVQDTAGLQVLDTRSGSWSPGERRQLPLAELRARVTRALQEPAR